MFVLLPACSAFASAYLSSAWTGHMRFRRA
jgi:hypothetical protein